MTTIEYTGFATNTLDKPYAAKTGQRYDFTYIDPDGRRLHTSMEDVTVSEETCEGWRVEASVSLPEPGTEAAVLVVRALMAAMEIDDRYQLVEVAS
ncbi:hypothetical protein [Nocardiopsis lucentensis]|uniref:hypothetical protein n=1 Tax=Nocardiopsis lucentensis TaxID=53441 RepID=UPI00034652CC|nr:hypothetical protein [Nocardiopsis lucentensis]